MNQIWRNRLADLALLSLLIVGGYFLLRKLFFLVFPIFLALIFSEVIRKNMVRLHPLSDGVKRILTILVLLIFFALLSLAVILLTDRLLHTVTSLSTLISRELDGISSFVQEKIHSMESMFSRLLKRDMENSLTSYLPSLFQQFLQKFLSALPSVVGKLVEQVPRFFLSLLIFVVATYYFSCDRERIFGFMKGKIKAETAEKIQSAKERFFKGLKQYLKAYLLLYLLTFSELFLGLTLLKFEGAAGKAALIAFVDLLPIFGCGTVLIPWAIVSFLLGKTATTVGLLVLYAIIFVIRQLTEPKIVGDSIGLHPVVSLVLVIGGLALFGFFGMIFLPLVVTCLKEQPTKQKKKGP